MLTSKGKMKVSLNLLRAQTCATPWRSWTTQKSTAAGFVLLKIAQGEADEAVAAPDLAAGVGRGAGAVDHEAAAEVAAALGVVQRARASQGADPAVEVTPGARAAQSLGVGPGPDRILNPAAEADPETEITNVLRANHQ